VGFLFFADIAVKKPKGWHERYVGFFQQWFCFAKALAEKTEISYRKIKWFAYF
jgi:hypothetical protein